MRASARRPARATSTFLTTTLSATANFAMLTAERREVRRPAGQSYAAWILPPGKRNEALDTFVEVLAYDARCPAGSSMVSSSAQGNRSGTRRRP